MSIIEDYEVKEGRYVQWKVCGKADLERIGKWYEHKSDGVIESEGYKIFWDMNIESNQVIEARRPDIAFINKEEKEVKITDEAVPGDARVKDKELEK